MKNNDLNGLNEILFDTLRGLQKGDVDEKKATAITNVANSIINNCKTQLTAYKLSKGKAYRENFGKLPEGKKEGDTYEMKNDFALHMGYKNVTHAMDKMGKNEFKSQFNEWSKEN
jgi:hypothetical protein